MECRTEDSSDIQTPGHCRSADTACSFRLLYMWPDATLKDDSNTGHKVSWASWQWWQVTPSLLMDEERGKFLSVWSTCLQSQVWLSEWLGLWRADNLLIPVWVTAWLPEANQRRGELCLISGHHYKCYRHKMWSGEALPQPHVTGSSKTQNGKH